MAENIVESIIVKLGLDGSQYNREADKAVSKNDKLNKSVKETDKVVGAVTGTLAKWFSAMAIATGVVKLVNEVQKLNNELFFLEKNLGMSSQSIKNWQNAAGAMGGSAQGMTSSMKSLNMGMNDFVMMGDTSLLPFMNVLGVSMVDAQGKIRNTDKVMLDLADSFSKMDREQAFSIASKMGIDEGTFNTLVQGRQEMEKMLDYQSKMYKSSEAELKASRELAQNRALLGSHWESLKTMMVNSIIPLFVKLSKVALGVFEYLQNNKEVIQAVFKGIATTIGLILLPILAKATLAALAFIAPFAPFIITVGLLGAAFGLLYSDYKVWAEGGKYLFDWGAFRDYIDNATLSTDNLKNAFKNLTKDMITSTIPTLKGYADIIKLLSQGEFRKAGALAAEMMVNFGEKVGNVVDDVTGNKQGTFIETGRNMVGRMLDGGYTPPAISSPVTSSQSASGEAAISKLIKTEGTKRVYQLANGQTETRTGGTVAWRNNNPGNLKFEFAGSADKTVKSRRSREKALSDAQKRYKGVIDLDQWGNAIFETMESGAVAKAQLLKKSFGNQTYQKMLRGYAKSDYSGKTNYASYEATIAKHAKSKGVNLEGKSINSMSSAEFNALAEAMVIAEGVKKGEVERSGIATGAKSAQASMRQGDYINLSQAQANKPIADAANKVDVSIGNVTIQTSSSTMTGTGQDLAQGVQNQFYQFQSSFK